jgi:hypothetical protein
MTFKPLTEDRGEELLMSYLAASRAKTLALPEKAQESTESDQACGPTWRGSLARFDPATSSWRTAQPSLLEDLGESSVIWPRSGMTAGGQCWELSTSAPRINVTASGLWRTPQAQDGMRGAYKSKERLDAHLNRGHQLGLANQVAHRHIWPTPTAHNAKEGGFPSEHNRNTPTLSAQAGGSLNPDWVEWLMNWPITWSSFNAVNQEKFQRWQETSAAALQESGQLRTMWWDRDPSQAPSGQQPDEQPEQELGDSLQKMPRITARQPEVEGSHEGSDLPLLRDGLHLQASQREDMQQGMREQAGMDEAQIVPRVASGVVARVDRLKAIGNGQVPLCAATAWRLLA